MRYLINDT